MGKAKNLKKRVSSYFQNSKNLLEKTKILVSQIKKIRSVIAESEIQALLLEANYIKLFKPKYNAKLTDDKAYPLIRITYKDNYPKVLISRRNEDNPPAHSGLSSGSKTGGSLYFGPFPNSSAVRLVLKTIRRIFPFQSATNHPNKICLYNHLGLCPCPSVLKDKEYKKNIQHIITFLKGDTKKVISNLEKERAVLSKLEEFEKAEVLQRKIEAINYVTNPSYKKFDFKVSPNLDEDLRYKELLDLKEALLRHNVSVKNLERIECYDISNISGTNATGSMVVFTNGDKDSSQYRKFKIKYIEKMPNDFAMMQEVLQRRIQHPEWPLPDLILVDGGKGQVSSAMEVLKEKDLDIPLIGLAKREETIIIPQIRRHSGRRSRISPANNFIELSLSKDSEALKLIMRIRDEAHRFAITYHRKLRSKQLVSR